MTQSTTDDRYVTLVFRHLTQEEKNELFRHPKMRCSSWSHAIDDRDKVYRALQKKQTELDCCEERLKKSQNYQSEIEELQEQLNEYKNLMKVMYESLEEISWASNRGYSEELQNQVNKLLYDKS